MSTKPFRIEIADDHYVVGDSHDGTRPSYVFLHGLGSIRTGEKSESLREHALARGHAFMRFDLRGHGDSTGRLGKVPVSELITDTIKVLEHHGPAILVGSSLGGLVGAHVAAERPDLVHQLALLAPAFGLMPRLSQRVDEEGCLMTGEGEKFYVLPEVLRDAEALDERSLPQRIQAPTLIVHGTADDVIPQVVSEMFFGALDAEQKQLWIVPDGDHRLNQVATEIWQRIDALPENGTNPENG